jgi:hypothetical protein
MSSTQIEARAPSGTVLAFRPRAPARPAPPAPGWVPDELGMARAVLLAVVMTVALCGMAFALWAASAPGSASAPRADPASTFSASGSMPERIALSRP